MSDNERVHTEIYGFSFDAGSPAATVLPARYFEKLSGKLDIVEAVLNDLHAAFPCVVLRPGVAVETVSLVACMTSL